MTIALFDPSVASENLGDEIIRDAVVTHLGQLWPDEQIVHLPTQEVIGPRSRRIARSARFRIVGGTNLLSSHMLRYRQWQIGLRDAAAIQPTILMGVGWWQYQGSPDIYTSAVLRRVLGKNVFHSVRDSYTRDKLAKIGVHNVVNTSCPTTWSLTPQHCSTIPSTQAKEVVLTLTDYHQAPKTDVALIDLLADRYEKVYFWPQGAGDLSYAQRLGKMDRLTLLRPSLSAYDELLRAHEVDFVGTRLHAGIRALQHRRRSMILAVDNRSREISSDTGLPVIAREDIAAIDRWIGTASSTILHLPAKEIDLWKAQFQKVGEA